MSWTHPWVRWGSAFCGLQTGGESGGGGDFVLFQTVQLFDATPYQSVRRDLVLADMLNGNCSINVLLPLAPADGYYIAVKVISEFLGCEVFVTGGVLAQPMPQLDTKGQCVWFVYSAATSDWQVVAEVEEEQAFVTLDTRANAASAIVGNVGVSSVITGTATGRTPTAGSVSSSLVRTSFVSAATINALCGRRDTQLTHSRQNGFWAELVYVVSAIADPGFFFIGLQGNVAAPAVVSPVGLFDCLGICGVVGSANVHVIHNDASGAATLLDTLIPFRAGATLALRLTQPRNAGPCRVSVQHVEERVTYEALLSANLPAAATLLARNHYASNNSVAVAIELALSYERSRLYV